MGRIFTGLVACVAILGSQAEALPSRFRYLTDGLRYDVYVEFHRGDHLPRLSRIFRPSHLRRRWGIYQAGQGGEREVNEALLAALGMKLVLSHPSRLFPAVFESRFGSRRNFIQFLKTSLANYLDPHAILITNDELKAYLDRTADPESAKAAFASYKAGDWAELYTLLPVFDRAVKRYKRNLPEVTPALELAPQESAPAFWNDRANNADELKARIAADVRRRFALTHKIEENSASATHLAALEQSEEVESRLHDLQGPDGPRQTVFAALVGSLDANSKYFFGSDYAGMWRGFTASQRGEFGLRTQRALDGAAVVAVEPDSPAARAGLRSGDVVTKVDQNSLMGLNPAHMRLLLSGPPGSVSRVAISRDGQPMEISLERRRTSAVTADVVHWRDRAIGYLQIGSFQARTGSDAREKIRELERRNIRGLILDLRNNAGGRLEPALELAEYFLGRPVRMEFAGIEATDQRLRPRPWLQSIRNETSSSDHFTKPMVVLLNRASGSSAEVLISLLRRSRRAILLGPDRSYGKGVIQSLVDMKSLSFRDRESGDYFKLPDQLNAALLFTIGYALGSEGVSPQQVGIGPDVFINDVHDGSTEALRRSAFAPPLPAFRWTGPSLNLRSMPAPWMPIDRFQNLLERVKKRLRSQTEIGARAAAYEALDVAISEERAQQWLRTPCEKNLMNLQPWLTPSSSSP